MENECRGQIVCSRVHGIWEEIGARRLRSQKRVSVVSRGGEREKAFKKWKSVWPFSSHGKKLAHDATRWHPEKEDTGVSSRARGCSGKGNPREATGSFVDMDEGPRSGENEREKASWLRAREKKVVRDCKKRLLGRRLTWRRQSSHLPKPKVNPWGRKRRKTRGEGNTCSHGYVCTRGGHIWGSSEEKGKHTGYLSEQMSTEPPLTYKIISWRRWSGEGNKREEKQMGRRLSVEEAAKDYPMHPIRKVSMKVHSGKKWKSRCRKKTDLLLKERETYP